MSKKSLSCIICALFFQVLAAQNLPELIDIGIFGDRQIKEFSFTVINGRYLICNESIEEVDEIRPYKTLTFRISGESSFEIWHRDSLLFQKHSITLQAMGFYNSFILYPIEPSMKMRAYDGSLQLKAENGQFKFVNIAPLESYVAGTVQAESGYNHTPEFYKAQAIIIRTYAMKNIARHRREGFQLCDRVHCQAYYGKAVDPDIISAVDLSRGMLLVDENGELLNTVYHANCGGQTINSEDLWPNALPYLVSDIDTFCLSKPGSVWERRIPSATFRHRLKTQLGFNPSDEEWQKIIQFEQNERIHFLDSQDRVHLARVRATFGLRSTYFSISMENDTLLLSGRGFGHGVGLCQEGAMERARQGHKKEEILGFYYKGSRIIRVETDIVYE